MAMKDIKPRAWQIWIPGYEGRYLWNFATQRVMSCVYPGALTPVNLYHKAGGGYTLKRYTDLLCGGKGTYYTHKELAEWLNPMNPRNKPQTPDQSDQSDKVVATSVADDGGTYIVAAQLDGNCRPTCFSVIEGVGAFDKALKNAQFYTIDKGVEFQVYKLVAETKQPSPADVQIKKV